MLTLPQLLEKTARVVQTELTDYGQFTPHFSALDPCGQLTIFTLSTCQHPDALKTAFRIMHAYSQCFHPTGLVLVFGHPTSPEVPTITAFDLSGESRPIEFAAKPSPTISVLPFSSIEPFLQLSHTRPRSEAARAEAVTLWALIESTIISPIAAHPSTGNN